MVCSVHSSGERTYWPTDFTGIPDLSDFAVSKATDPTKKCPPLPATTCVRIIA